MVDHWRADGGDEDEDAGSEEEENSDPVSGRSVAASAAWGSVCCRLAAHHNIPVSLVCETHFGGSPVHSYERNEYGEKGNMCKRSQEKSCCRRKTRGANGSNEGKVCASLGGWRAHLP